MLTESSRRQSDKKTSFLFFTQLLKAQSIWLETKSVSLPWQQQKVKRASISVSTGRSQEGALNLYLITDLHLDCHSFSIGNNHKLIWTQNVSPTITLNCVDSANTFFMPWPHDSVFASLELLWRSSFPAWCRWKWQQVLIAVDSSPFVSACACVCGESMCVCVCHCAHDDVCVRIRWAWSVGASAKFFSLRL